jgi:prophage regulatory protein
MTPDGASFDRLLTVGDVLALTGYRSRTTLWRKVKAAGFPRSARTAPASVRWGASDIQRWIEGLPAQRYQ